MCNLAMGIKSRLRLNQVHNQGSVISSEASRRTNPSDAYDGGAKEK